MVYICRVIFIHHCRFCFLIRKGNIFNIIISVVISLVSLVLVIYGDAALDSTVIFHGTFAFFIGTLIYYAFYNADTVSTKSILKNFYLLLTIILLILAFVFIDQVSAIGFAFPLIWGLVIYLFINAKYPLWFTKLLNLKYIVYLGTISYSFYLVHPMMIFVTEKILKKSHLQDRVALSALGTLVYLSLTIIIASLTYKYIEVPGKDIYKRFRINSNKSI